MNKNIKTKNKTIVLHIITNTMIISLDDVIFIKRE